MENNILNDYVDRVYGYSIRQTFNREEADELSQEILYTALKQLPKLVDETRFEPWLWGLAANVTRVFRRKQGRQRAMYSYDSLENIMHVDDNPWIDEDIYMHIRTKIVGLSKIYRDIIVLHYYDNLSCKEISQKLGIPEGTVTWRLSEGRRKLKKECINMTETALRPVEMTIRIQGNGNYNGKDKPFPWVFIDDALSQNILYHCYKEAKNVEELSKLCGVPAYFIEDTIKKLLYREAVKEPARGKYLTDFIIYDQEHNQYNEKAVSLLTEIADEFASLLKAFTKKVIETGVYIAGKPESELYYLYGILAMEHLNKNYNPFSPVPYKVKYDGNEWTYHAHMASSYKTGGMCAEKNLNVGSGGSYSHHNYQFAGFAYRPMMYDYQINVCEKLINRAELTEKEKEFAAELIHDGYLANENGTVKISIPSFTLSEKDKFNKLSDEYFRDFMPKYVEIIKKYTDGYRKLFPKHLKEEVDRAFYFLSVGFFTNAVLAAQAKGLLDRPSANRFCDVLIQFK